jgi:hypothetical protein
VRELCRAVATAAWKRSQKLSGIAELDKEVWTRVHDPTGQNCGLDCGVAVSLPPDDDGLDVAAWPVEIGDRANIDWIA